MYTRINTNYVFASFPYPFVVHSGKLTKCLVWNMNRQHPIIILLQLIGYN